MGSARNVINVLSSHVVVACPGGSGTISEIALALKYGKTVILLNFDTGDIFDSYRRSGRLLEIESPAAAVARIKQILT
jgi:predicted Rossmann-fold nucleotide-binding protein